jgi:hypothetical protein
MKERFVEALAQEATTAYVAGNLRRSIEIAELVLERAPEHKMAWQLIGANSCLLGEAPRAREAVTHLPPLSRKLIVELCRRSGYSIP